MKLNRICTLSILLLFCLFATAQEGKSFLKEGDSFRKDGQFSDAIEKYSIAIDLNPQYLKAVVARAEVYEQLNKLEEAAADYKMAALLGPDKPDVYYNGARLYYLLKQHQEAIALCDKGLAQDAKHLPTLQVKVRAALALNDLDQASEAANKALDVKGTTDTYYLHGLVSIKLRDYETAVTDFEQVIDWNPLYEDAYVGLADVELKLYDQYNAPTMKLRQLDKAIDHCTVALDLNPRSKPALFVRSKAYERQKEYFKAIDDVSRVIAIGPAEEEHFYQRALYYQGYGQHQNAINDLNKVISMNENNYLAYYSRAVSHEANMENESAIRDYELALANLTANDAETRNKLEQGKQRAFELGREEDVPEIVLNEPKTTADGAMQIPGNWTEAVFSGKVSDKSLIKSITINGQKAPFKNEEKNPQFVAPVGTEDLGEVVMVVATDIYGNSTTLTYNVERTETDAPLVRIIAPYASDNGEIYLNNSTRTLFVEGKVEDQSAIKSISIDGVNASFATDKLNPGFSAKIEIVNKDKFTVKVVDAHDNITENVYTLSRRGVQLSASNPMGKTWVVFIENSNYRSFAPIEGPTKDVQRMKEAFADYEIHNIIHKKDMTKEALDRFFSIELRDLVRTNGVNSLLVWYAGHGKFVNNTGYWIPVNAKRDDEFTYFNINSLKASMQSYSDDISHTLVVSDACESGPSFYELTRGGQERRCDDGEDSSRKSSQVLSSAGYELAVDDSEFTKTFAAMLQSNGDHCISIDKIANSVSDAVRGKNKQTPKFGKISGFEDENGTFFFIKK